MFCYIFLEIKIGVRIIAIVMDLVLFIFVWRIVERVRGMFVSVWKMWGVRYICRIKLFYRRYEKRIDIGRYCK